MSNTPKNVRLIRKHRQIVAECIGKMQKAKTRHEYGMWEDRMRRSTRKINTLMNPKEYPYRRRKWGSAPKKKSPTTTTTTVGPIEFQVEAPKITTKRSFVSKIINALKRLVMSITRILNINTH